MERVGAALASGVDPQQLHDAVEIGAVIQEDGLVELPSGEALAGGEHNGSLRSAQLGVERKSN
jgi:hypothetical protein